MKRYRTPKWTKETLHKEALKYDRRVDFKKANQGPYQTARKHGWLDEICSHMELNLTYWTKDAVVAEAARYTTRTAFQVGNPSAYKYEFEG